MNPNLKWRALFILFVIVFCIYFLFGYPDFPTSLAKVKENFARQIKLGLDLQGGTHLILQVQVQEAIAQETDNTVDRLTTYLRTKNIHYDEVRRADDTHILVRGIDPSQVAALRDYITTQYNNVWDMSASAGEANSYTLTLRANAIAGIQDSTMTQSLETIERRINGLGLTEPTIQLHGRKDNEILIQLPGEGDPTRIKPVIQEGGQLELRLVEDPITYTSQAEALSRHGGILPAGTELVPGRSQVRNPTGGFDTGESWYILARAAVVTGRDLRSAVERRRIDSGDWVVDFSLSQEGASRFAPFTEQNVGRNMAIVLDPRVYMDPRHAAAHRGPLSRSRLDSPRCAGFGAEFARGHAFHAGLLSTFRWKRGPGLDPQSGHSSRRAGPVRRRSHPARHCRRHFAHRHGRGWRSV